MQTVPWIHVVCVAVVIDQMIAVASNVQGDTATSCAADGCDINDWVHLLQTQVLNEPAFGPIALDDHAPVRSLPNQPVTVAVVTAPATFNVEGFVRAVPEGTPVSIFFGIPYSRSRAPPFRFEPPEEYIHEAGSTFNASAQGSKCVQSDGTGSEDCLNLDIYAPHNQPPNNPVMVWIHGGAWLSGSKNDYAGRLWAGRQWHPLVPRVVAVTVNYRMNLLGFPDFGAAGERHNLALLDLIMALTWVSNHIGNFGGNTGSITIFGESAGSMNVLNLWASARAQGLFHRAISQSPYIWDFADGTSSPLRSRADRVATMSTCMQQACNSVTPCTLQTPTLDQLVSAGCFGPWYGPMSDDSVIVNDFFQNLCTGIGRVPLLVGNNALEVGLWILMGTYQNKETQMKAWIRDLLLTNDTGSECVLTQLGQMYGNSGKMKLDETKHSRSERELHYATSGIFFNMLTEVLSRDTHAYQYLFNESFSHTFFGMCEDGAHACEVAYVIGEEGKYQDTGTGKTNSYSQGIQLESSLQSRMRHVWAEFALTGNPGWHTDSIGQFENGALNIDSNGAPFSTEISQALYDIMCAPSQLTISTSC